MHIKELPKVEAVLKKDGKPQFLVVHYSSFKEFIGKIEFDGVIDEEAYLKSSSKVGQEMKANALPSPTSHYKNIGYFERRTVKVLR